MSLLYSIQRGGEGANIRLTTWIGENDKKNRIKAAIHMPLLLLSHAVHKSQYSDAQMK